MDAQTVEGGEIGTTRRPANEALRPVLLAVVRLLVGLARIIPPNLRLVVVAQHKLIAGALVEKPVVKVLAGNVWRGHERLRQEIG